MAADGRVTFIAAGACTVDADRAGGDGQLPWEEQQSFQVSGP